MSNDKTKYQLLLERLISDPALKTQALQATPEEFLALCNQNGLKITAENAKALQERLKATLSNTPEELSAEEMGQIAGGIDCAWDCGPLQCQCC